MKKLLEFIGSLVNFFITCFVIFIVIGILGVFYLFYYYSQDLPSHEQLAKYDPPIVTRLYTNDGLLLEEYAKENRIFVEYNEIPDLLTKAFIAAEDKNFYAHPGVDIQSIIRAALQNIANLGNNKLSGGSTITQQVVKNFLLTNERSIRRKIKEAILAYRITNTYDKNKILELYLNQIYLGGNSYGVVTAAQHYFNKTLDDLSLEEMALLAALPKAPSNFDPYVNKERVLVRRNWVLDRMYEDGYITKKQKIAAESTPINLKKRDKSQSFDSPYFAEEVRQRLVEKYGKDTFYEAGFTVKTTINTHLQKIATDSLRLGIELYDHRHGYRGPIAQLTSLDNWEKQLEQIIKPETPPNWELAVILSTSKDKINIGLASGKKSIIEMKNTAWVSASKIKKGNVILVTQQSDNSYLLKQIPNVNGAIVVMNQHTGQVVAMDGGFNFDTSKFNRATQAMRQTGSVFKPFVYLAALEEKYPPNSLVKDAPIELSQGPGLSLWRPKNYGKDFLGPIPMRRALELSRNLATVRIGQAVGIPKIVEITQRFGIAKNPPSNPAMVLGSTETTLLAMTTAYAIIANGGQKIEPYFIELINNRQGDIIERRDKNICANCIASEHDYNNPISPIIETQKPNYVIDPHPNYQIISFLEGVIKRGTGQRSKELGRTLAGKTGTSNDSKDTWFIGFSPDLVVGVYIGFDNPKGLGGKETGATVAQPVFISFMKEALKNYPDRDFNVPEGLIRLNVDRFTGEIIQEGDDNPDGIVEFFQEGTISYDSTPYIDAPSEALYTPEIMEFIQEEQ